MRSWLKLALLFLQLGLIFYGVFLTALFGFQRVLIFNDLGIYHGPEEVNWPHAQIIPISPEPGLVTHSWFTPPIDMQHPVLVTMLGQGGWLFTRADLSLKQQALGYGTLVVGYRGYNRDPGHPGEQALYRDARANINWLLAQGYPASRLVLVGESLGTGVATQMALEYDVAGLILEMPYTHLCAAARNRYPYVPACHLMFDRFDTLDKIAQVRAPVLVIHGRKDQIVPFEQGQKIFATITSDKTACFLDQGTHFNIYAVGGWACETDFLSKLARRD